jgi:hypothetical protein
MDKTKQTGFGRFRVVIAGALLAGSVAAHAALPAAATTALTDLTGNVTDILAAIWPIVALSVGGFALIKLFKKGAARAV